MSSIPSGAPASAPPQNMPPDDDRTPSFSGENRAPALGAPVPSLRVLGGAPLGKVFRLEELEHTIGRSSEASIHIPDAGVSRKHARVKRRGPLVCIVDLGSKNGTYVNGHRARTPYVLTMGDVIRLGPNVTLRLVQQDALDEQADLELFERATRDALTGALNRRTFDEQLGDHWRSTQRTARACTLVVFDLDHFKRINDDHGHSAGDRVLAEAVRVVRATLRRDDALARIGGEEFAVLSFGLAEADARAVGERIRAAIAQHRFEHHGRAIAVTASVGIAVARAGAYASPDDLRARADAALYRAKRGGRNRVVTWSDERVA